MEVGLPGLLKMSSFTPSRWQVSTVESTSMV